MNIDDALRSGALLHCFRSGGGLRVASLKRAGSLVGYGESPSLGEALGHAAIDFAAGHRSYEEQYSGEKALYTHYLTGSSMSDGPGDAWVLRGSTIDAEFDGGLVVVRLCGYGETHVPQDVNERVLASGDAEVWSERGYRFRSKRSSFANGEAGVSTIVVKAAPGRDYVRAWMFRITKTGAAPLFITALAEALAAEPVENQSEEP